MEQDEIQANKTADDNLNQRFKIVQGVCDRICDAHDSKIDFIKEMKELFKKYPLNYSINYLPETFIKEEKTS